MKHYTKDGITKPQNRIVLYTTEIVDGVEHKLQVINPPHDILLEDGWVEYVTPQPTAEQLLNRAKRQRIKEIQDYDASSAVNEFFIGEASVWLDKATRAGLKLRFEAEIAIGKTDTTLWYNGQQCSLPLATAMQVLYAIEVYASACYDCTQQHIANVMAMTTIEEVEQYEELTGYPDKLHF